MAVKLAFNRVEQFCDGSGVPYSGAKLFTYTAGSTTKQTTYTESTGSTPNTNPIVLDSSGRLPQPVWLTSGVNYKFVLAPSTDTDPPASPIWTLDNISGINDSTSAQNEWVSGPAPTFVSATSFTLSGDQTSTFVVNRRLKTTNTSGTIYSTITASAFGALTTVTVVNDSGVLDTGLSAVSYGLLAPTNPSLPPNLGLFTTKGDTVSAATSGRGVRLAVGTDGQAHAADSTQTGGTVWVDNPSRPNLLINPNWQLDQSNEGALYTVNTTDTRGPDGWSGTAVGAGVFKLRTLADPDNAALKCLEITCTTADAAIAAADDYFIYTAIEGYDAASLMAGTSSAQPITVQFKFKTNITGVYGISVANSALNRRYIGIITVADTNEHEYSVSLTMDTTGTWLYTNGVGTYLRICLAAGSNFQATASAWAAGAEQTTSAQCNFMSNIANIAYLKRIQLIPGALVQAYRPADIQKELVRAQRYYAKTYSQGTAVASGTTAGRLEWGYPTAGGSAQVMWRFPTSMRAAPTVTTYATDGTSAKLNDGVGTNQNSASATVGTDGVMLSIVAGNLTGVSGHATASARLS